MIAAILATLMALAITIKVDLANNGIDIWMGVAVVAWLFVSYAWAEAIHT